MDEKEILRIASNEAEFLSYVTFDIDGKGALFKKKDEFSKKLLKARREVIKKRFSDITPDVDADFICDTCGSRNGECHPDSGFCFLCDTDNWRRIKH